MISFIKASTLVCMSAALLAQAAPPNDLRARGGTEPGSKTSYAIDGPGTASTGTGSITTHPYETEGGAGKCGWAPGSFDPKWVTAIQGEKGTGVPGSDQDGEAFVNLGLNCGQCIEVTANGKTIEVTVLDERNRPATASDPNYPSTAGLDLSTTAFRYLFGADTGTFAGSWKPVPASNCHEVGWSQKCSGGTMQGNHCH